jgi:hypothetical protein
VDAHVKGGVARASLKGEVIREKISFGNYKTNGR